MGWIAIVPGRTKKEVAELKKVEKSDRQNTLVKIAKKTEYGSVYKAAINKLTDPELLADLIIEYRDLESGLLALDKVTDQGILTRISYTVTNNVIRMRLAQRLTDKDLAQKIYESISQDTGEWFDLRVKAAESVTDPALALSVYHDIAKRLQDPSTSRVSSTDDVDAAFRAIQRVKDKGLLKDIMKKSANENYRFYASKRLKELEK